MNKHTPGPWTAQEDCRGRFAGTLPGPHDPLPHGTLAYGIYGESTRIAVLEESQDWRPQELIDADAALIAAAPELLEACCELLRHFAPSTDKQPPEANKWFRFALAAIAKAQGGAK